MRYDELVKLVENTISTTDKKIQYQKSILNNCESDESNDFFNYENNLLIKFNAINETCIVFLKALKDLDREER